MGVEWNTKKESESSKFIDAVISGENELYMADRKGEKPTGQVKSRNTEYIGGVSIADYNETVKRIKRHHEIIWRHPRTSVQILCTSDKKINPYQLNRKKPYLVVSAVPYKQTQNATRIQKITLKTPIEVRKQLLPSQANQLVLKAETPLRIKKTKTWKTIWYMKHSRRS